LCVNIETTEGWAMDDDSSGGRNRSASLRRALALLAEIGAPGTAVHGVALGELAARVGVDKSTASRLLGPLREWALVETDELGRYRLGVGVLRLGQSYLERLDVRAVALPVLRDLTANTGETSHLVLYQHPDVVYVEKVEADSAVRMRSRVGRVEPAAYTGVGRAYLAYAPGEVVDDVLARGLTKRTPSTITSVRQWRAELAATRERGYAIDDCENEADVRCVGAPVFDHLGQPVAALSLAGPAWRLTRERAESLGPVVAAAADAVSAALGASPSAATA
jgi:IclR family transcriptional regulator, acetate operon repressor